MELYCLNGPEITENLIPADLEAFCLQGLLEGDLQIESKKVREDVALDPSLFTIDRATSRTLFRSKKARSTYQTFLYQVATCWFSEYLD